MKKKLILFSISVAASVIIIYCIPYFKLYKSAQVKNITYENGLSIFFKKMNAVNPELRQKKYYYFSTWNVRCRACIEEMPRLESLSDSISKKIGCIYISDDSDETVKNFLKRKNISSKNFTYLNDMGEFISAVYSAQNIKLKVFPTHFVTDSLGKILIFKVGSLSYGKFKDGHKLTEADKKFLEKLQDPIIAYLKAIR